MSGTGTGPNPIAQSLRLQVATAFLESPAGVSALLLHGMLFGFAVASYLFLPWRRSYTIAFYLIVLLLAAIVLRRRWPRITLAINRVDMFFGAFLVLVLASSATHWWPGTAQYFLLAPFFFILPYLLGRLMNDRDVLIFWNMLLALGGVLLSLMPIEYIKDQLPYVDWPNPFLFGQGHGVMLSGLLFSATFLVLVSRLLLAGIKGAGALGRVDGWANLRLYLVFGLVIIAVGWISARGSAIAAVLGAGVLFVFSSYCGAKRKVSIALVFAFFVVLAALNPFQDQFSKQFYQAVLQPPPIFLSSGSWFGSAADSSLDASGAPDSRRPILGEQACAAVKDSISDRWVHYQTALAIFFSHPLAGVGANRYGHYSCSGPGWFPHSTILQVLAELGLLGVAVYGLMLLMALHAIWKHYHSSDDVLAKAIAGWLLAYLIFQLATSQLYGNYFLSAGLYFVVGVASRIVNDDVSPASVKV